MVRRVVSVVSTAQGTVRAAEPALEANAYAVAEDIDLTVVLRGSAVELAVAGGEVPPGTLAGTPLPPSAAAQDLRGLLESGVPVHVEEAAMRRCGLGSADLVPGVTTSGPEALAALLRGADAVLAW